MPACAELFEPRRSRRLALAALSGLPGSRAPSLSPLAVRRRDRAHRQLAAGVAGTRVGVRGADRAPRSARRRRDHADRGDGGRRRRGPTGWVTDHPARRGPLVVRRTFIAAPAGAPPVSSAARGSGAAAAPPLDAGRRGRVEAAVVDAVGGARRRRDRG
jgi:hypothetical protein